jgi:hypothetical protein
MELQEFDKKKALDEAERFLRKSILTLSSILGVDHELFNPNDPNPYGSDHVFFNPYEVLQKECIALNKVIGEQNAR